MTATTLLRPGMTEATVQNVPLDLNLTINTPGSPSMPVAVISDSDVRFDESAMTPNKPYAYRLRGEWWIVVLRMDGQLDFYTLE